MLSRRTVLVSATVAPFVIATSVNAQEATPVVDVSLIEEVDIPFSEDSANSLRLDVFRLPERDVPRPAVVILPGFFATRPEYHEHARALAHAGFVAVPIDYRRESPGYLDDAQYAVRWLRANAAQFGIDPDRIGAYGHSSGGQLAALLGVRDTLDPTTALLAEHSSRVSSVVDLAGVSDMSIPSTATGGIGSAVVPGSGADREDGYQQLSPIAYVDDQSAPFLLIHSRPDEVHPVEDSQQMAQALQDAGVEVVFAYLANDDHFTIAEWGQNGALTLAFLNRQLHPET